MKKFFIVTLAIIVALIALIEVFEFIERDQNNLTDSLRTAGRIIDSTGPQNSQPIYNPGIACTMDAYMCPDGTYTGRSGTQCVFICPDGSGPR